MRRHLFNAAIFLLAGAVVNVAVAWGITASSTYPGWSRTATVLNNVEWPHSVPSHWPERAMTIQAGALGWRLDRYQAAADEERDGEFWRIEQFNLDIVRVGWPCRALQWEMWMDQVLPENSLRFDGQPRQTLWLSGIALRSENFGFSLGYKRLPIHPVWPGFAVNTLFYAAGLWLLLSGPFALRRFIRVRRGLCPACAYPMAESDVCSECGKALPERAKVTT